MSENEKIEQAADQTQKAPAPAEKPVKADKADKDKKGKTDKKDKPSFPDRAKRWFREMKSELKKVQWPTKKQTVNNTLIVIACVIVVGLFIWVFDWLAQAIISALLSLVGKG